MRVEVELIGHLKRNRFAAAGIQLKEESTVIDLLKRLKISSGEIGVPMVNRERVSVSRRLNDGDVITIFPLIGGG